MEISVMVADLKNELIAVSRELKAKEETAAKYRTLLEQLEAEISPLRDRYDAMKMAADALELVAPVKKQEIQPEIPVTETQKPPIRNIHHSRMPKKIGKFDPKGKKLSEYASINKAAKELGWSNSSLTQYIENTSKDKQIRLRGYYLQFIAA